MVFNLVFINNAFLSSFFFLFLHDWLILLNFEVDAQICNPAAELAITTGIGTNEANAKIETRPLKIETKIKNAQSNSKPYRLFYAFIKSL